MRTLEVRRPPDGLFGFRYQMPSAPPFAHHAPPGAAEFPPGTVV